MTGSYTSRRESQTPKGYRGHEPHLSFRDGHVVPTEPSQPQDPRDLDPECENAGDGPAHRSSGCAPATPDLDEVFASRQRHSAHTAAYASASLAAAAAACADALAVRMPPTSQAAAHRAFERQLLHDFRAAVDKLDGMWRHTSIS